jgi:hypothetical protein
MKNHALSQISLKQKMKVKKEGGEQLMRAALKRHRERQKDGERSIR